MDIAKLFVDPAQGNVLDHRCGSCGHQLVIVLTRSIHSYDFPKQSLGRGVLPGLDHLVPALQPAFVTFRADAVLVCPVCPSEKDPEVTDPYAFFSAASEQWVWVADLENANGQAS